MDVWKAYNTIGRTAKSPVGGGSDTAELFAKTLDIVAGSTAPGHWYAFKTIRDMVAKHGRHNMEAYLRKAMFDPDYAIILHNITKGKPYSVNNFQRLMTGILVAGDSEDVSEAEAAEKRIPEINRPDFSRINLKGISSQIRNNPYSSSQPISFLSTQRRP